jgi:hypothetical protein
MSSMTDSSDPPGPPPGPPVAETPAEASTPAPARKKKHKARIEHKVPGRIRLKIPSARRHPEILEAYRSIFAAIPGVTEVTPKPATGSIIIHYDTRRETEFHAHFHRACVEQTRMAPPRIGDEIEEMTRKIEAEAEFLSQHSALVKAGVDFCRDTDRHIKLATGNTVDLKILLGAGLVAYTFLEIGPEAATPMWVTLALFTLHHLSDLQSGQMAGGVPGSIPARAH